MESNFYDEEITAIIMDEGGSFGTAYVKELAKDLLDARAERDALKTELSSGIIVQTAHILEQLYDERKKNDALIAKLERASEALEIALPYVSGDGWTRYQANDVRIITEALAAINEGVKG